MTNKKTDKTVDKKHPGKGKTPPSYGSPEADKMNKGSIADQT